MTDWRSLCHELYLALCRPQRPPEELMDRAHKALFPLSIEEIAKNPELARQFLRDAGMIDENGQLTPPYRPVEELTQRDAQADRDDV